MDSDNDSELTRYCFNCFARGVIAVREIENEWGTKKTKNYIQVCKNIDCWRYEESNPPGWKNAAEPPINARAEDRLQREGRARPYKPEPSPKAPHDWRPIVAAGSATIHQVETKSVGVPPRSNEAAPVSLRDDAEYSFEGQAARDG